MIDRKLYKGYFTQEDMSKWHCPTCNSGSLQVIEDKFILQHDSATKINYHKDGFDGYEMLSFILEELYDNKHEHAQKIAKKINFKKGI